MEFTEKERELLSIGLLSLLDRAVKAKGEFCDSDVLDAIDGYIKRVQALNERICLEYRE